MFLNSAVTSQLRTGILSRDTVRLMRIPFSYFLMPVFVFALSQANNINPVKALLCFFVLHLFIYPASNGYNSYMDKDEGSIGGLKRPPKPTRSLFYLSLFFDVIGLSLALLVGRDFFLAVLAYMVASRAYSYKGIRLKKYPVTGLFTIMVFQGALTFWMVYNAVNDAPMALDSASALVLPACSFLIGGFYPLTQVYQHAEDKKNGDITISYLLGRRGTFAFSAAMFLCSSALLYSYFQMRHQSTYFLLFLFFTLPVVSYFLWWFRKVWQDPAAASFEHAMSMNLIASTCLNLCFLLFIVLNIIR